MHSLTMVTGCYYHEHDGSVVEPRGETSMPPVDAWCPYNFPRPGAEEQDPDRPRWGEKGMPGHDE